MTYSIRKAIEELGEVLVRNVANSLIQLHFHQHATDKELEAYYGPAYAEGLYRP